MKKSDALTNFLFVSFLFFFLLMHCLTADKTFSEEENRVLSSFPVITIERVLSGDTARDLEKYIQDQFPLRSQFVAAKTALEISQGKLVSNSVYLAKEQSLIQQFNTLDQNRMQINLERFNDFAKSIAIPVDVLVIPSAAAINEALLPKYHQDLDQFSLLEEIKASLPDTHFVSVYNAMIQEEENLFYRTDHHLNAYGSYITYQAYMQHLNQALTPYTFEVVSESFKGTLSSKSGAFWIAGDTILKPMSNQPLNIRVRYDQQGPERDSVLVDENLMIKDQYTYYLDGNHALVEIDTAQPDKENLLILTDSYGHSLAPFLLTDFNQITFVDLRYYHGPVSEMLENVDRVLIYYGIESFLTDVNVAWLK